MLRSSDDAMPGYSSTPLAKKLGIKDGFRISLIAMPADLRKQLELALAHCHVADRKPLDFAMLFAHSQAELRKEFSKIVRRLAPAGMVWVSWPKKSSGLPTDLDENSVRAVGLAAGLVDVKVCAVTDVRSGLKFVRRLKDRKTSI